MKKLKRIELVLVAAVALMGFLGAAVPAEAAPASKASKAAPIGRTYFIVSLGMATDASEAYELSAGCVVFTRDLICDEGGEGDCGAWWWGHEGPQTRRQKPIGFRFQLIDDETGLPVEIEGKGRIDGRGSKSSVAGVSRAIEPTSGVEFNIAFAGRAVGAQRCLELVEDFEQENG